MVVMVPKDHYFGSQVSKNKEYFIAQDTDMFLRNLLSEGICEM